MLSNLSPSTKTRVAAIAALVMAGVTAYQVVTAGGHFTWWDVLPIAASVLGVATTDKVENTLGSPAAKAVVHGSLSALAAITATLTAFVGSEPAGVSLAKLLVAALGTLAVWAYPELGPALAPVEQTGKVTAADVAAVAVELAAGEHAAGMAPDLPVAPAAPAAEPVEITDALRAPGAAPTPTYDQVAADLAGASAYTPPPVPAAPIPEPAAPLTRPMAAVTAGTPAPTA